MGLFVGAVFYPVVSTSRRHKLIVWGFRLAAIPIAVILYVLLVRNFYTSNPYAGELLTSCFSYVLLTLVLSMFWVSLPVVYPKERQQLLQRVRVPSFYPVARILTLFHVDRTGITSINGASPSGTSSI